MEFPHACVATPKKHGEVQRYPASAVEKVQEGSSSTCNKITVTQSMEGASQRNSVSQLASVLALTSTLLRVPCLSKQARLG
jgi:hypothetical protein